MEEYLFRKSDGSYAYVFDRGFVIRDQEGRAIRMVGAMQDLTERMRMVDALRESEARFRNLFSHMSAGVAIYRAVQNGEDFIFIEVNPAVERIEKVRREDTIGRSVLEVFPGIKEFGLFDVFQRVWRTGIPEHHPISEYRDGRISGWRENTVFRLPSGEIVSIYEDVTEKKQAEEAIRLSEVRYRTLAEGIPDIIARFDREHRHTYINHAIERVTGKPAESFLGMTNQDLGMPDELCRLWDEKLDQVFEKGSAVTFEFAYPLGENLQFFESRIIPERSQSGEVLSVISVARDITDEKRAEKGRMESEARLDSAMEIGSLAWWEMELPEGTVRFDPRKAAMLGYPPGQFRHYTDFTALLHPDDIEPATQAMRGHLEGQNARYEVDYRLRTATGDYRWFRDVGGITNRHPDGSPATVTGIVIDITVAKEAEESLRRSELFLKQTEELTQVGGWEYDAATRRFRWTDEMYCIYGVPRDFDPSDISHNLSFYSPEDRVVIESAFRRAVEEGAPYDIELRFRSADGKDKWVRTTAQVERRDGIVSRVYGNLMDITDQKAAENALRESELWFREIFNKANDGIELIGVTEDGLPGRFIGVNDIACSMLGYQREELLRMSPFDVNTDWYDQPLEKIISELGTRGHATFQTEHRRKDGTVFPVEINSHRIALGGKDYFISVVRDITERKKTHTALVQSEERYRTLVEEIPDLVIVQRKGELLYVNPAITRLMGMNADQLLHSNILTYIAPESRDDVKTAMERRERGDKVDPYVVRLLLPDRTERWVEVRGSRILFDGQPAILNILSDITDRKRAQEALAESETRFRALIQNSSDIIRVLGRDRRIIYESPSAGRLLGYPPGSMIGKDPMEFVHPDDRERVTRDLGEVFEKTNPGISTEFRIRKADGEYLWVDTIGVNLLGVPGVDGIVVTTRVIQQRKEAEEALRESEQRYEEVIANSPDSIFVVEVTGEARFRILYMNPVSEEHMGVSNASASGKYLEELFSPEVSGHLSAMYRKCLDAGATLRYEESQNHPEGKRYYSTTLVPLKVAGGKIARIIGISHDITSRRLMESEIRSLNTVLEQRVIERTRELESANEALVAEIGQREAAEERLRASLEEKLTLLREVHHRVKNNLQIIVSLLNLQSRYITDESTLAAIRESQNRVRAMALVHEKLYQTETLSQINLDDYLKYLGKSLFQFYGANTRGITFSVDTGDVHVDINTAIPFGLIMNELISNSLKYAFPDKRRGAVSISVRRDDHALHVEYRDTGVGIPEDLDWQNTKSLGLRLVHSLVSQLNGSIALDRREGTAFSMVLHEKE
ncbi:MAG: putative diguanylate cyclase [Methanoregulaceae archaeon PtaB.Bin056]|nr:MAG: putative diguanylate cyclase [Methanoregulaceae archaeon PtaB.Bin056]